MDREDCIFQNQGLDIMIINKETNVLFFSIVSKRETNTVNTLGITKILLQHIPHGEFGTMQKHQYKS